MACNMRSTEAVMTVGKVCPDRVVSARPMRNIAVSSRGTEAWPGAALATMRMRAPPFSPVWHM